MSQASSPDLACQMLGVGLVLGEQSEARLKQRFQLCILRRGDERVAQGSVHRAMKGDLVLDIGAVESSAPDTTTKQTR